MALLSFLSITILWMSSGCAFAQGHSSADSCKATGACGQSLLQVQKGVMANKVSTALGSGGCKSWCHDPNKGGKKSWDEKCGKKKCSDCEECVTTTTTTRPPLAECELLYKNELVSDGSLTIDSGEPFEAAISATGTLSYKFEFGPAGLSVNMRTGALHWQPDATQAGSQYGVMAITADGASTSRCLVSLTVVPKGDLPADALYVAPSHGDDDNDGSVDAPFETVEEAAKAASPGDVIYIRGGRYALGTDDIEIEGSPTNPVIITRLPGERVQFDILTDKIGFNIEKKTVGVTFQGLELYGAAETNDHWDVLRTSWWRVQDNRIGGKTGFQVDGYHVVIEDCIIHDLMQKAVNIEKGRYVTVRKNIIYNIGHASLSGGHGIMRKWERNFNEEDDLAYYRWDFYGNLIFGVEQRIYSFIPWKGYCNMVIDEGKGILIDITKDDVMKARIAHNLVLYGGVDNIRLKMNPNMEVYNNAIMTESGRDHPIPDGITCKDDKDIVGLTLVGNLVQSFPGSTAFGCEKHISDSDGVERFKNNFHAGGGETKFNSSAVKDLGASASVFKDPSNLDFTKSNLVTADAGVDPAILTQLFETVQEEGIQVGPSGWRNDHVQSANTILESAPSEHLSSPFTGPSSEHDRVSLFYNVTSEWYQDMCKCTQLEIILPEGYDLARDLPAEIDLATA